MVVICSKDYSSDDKNEYHNKYSFDLSPFQKHAIDAITEGQHVLVTAHTGSGKTLPAEFAIEHFYNKGKKVIYTSPIKALSNQKYYEFSKKFENIDFGILTGDIKFNPEANVLIMTTEILQNYLYKRLNSSVEKSSNIYFEMDIENELGCVIFDEIHYINDADRGKVWEETIMMLPNHVQMVMLSATIDKADKFAGWCEQQKGSNKKVYLCSTNERVVPLHHYCYVNAPSAIFKKIKDKEIQKQIRSVIHKPIPIKKQNESFNDETYLKIKNMLNMLHTNNVYTTPAFVLNELCKYLKENNMLPALCFVFSRKNVEKYAFQISVNLLEDDSKVPYIVRKECEQMIRKLPNFEEYLQLPEYESMVSLLEKGIAIHHSGIMPILREIVEMMFSKGYIKLLFATETFAVGLNMPTKTVIFSNLSKFTSDGIRYLLGHEYTQMAGRAGRRNLDTVGHVIHCNNLFSNNYPTLNEYKTILSGTPQTLKSKFAISYHLLLNLTSIGNLNFKDFIERSMMQEDIEKSKHFYERELISINNDIHVKEEQFNSLSRVPLEELETYTELIETLPMLKNKKRKNAERDINNIKEKHNKFFDNDLKRWQEIKELKHKQNKLDFELRETNNYIINKCNVIFDLLEKDEYIHSIDNKYELTVKGKIASNLHEVHCLVMTEFIMKDELNNLDVDELVGLMSIFSNIRVSEDLKQYMPDCNSKLKIKINNLVNLCQNFQSFEINNFISSPIDCDTISYDIINECMEWCNSNNEMECKHILKKLHEEKSIFLGEYVKALLKINNISSELETICEEIGNIELLSKLKQISEKTMKFVATNQSLYV